METKWEMETLKKKTSHLYNPKKLRRKDSWSAMATHICPHRFPQVSSSRVRSQPSMWTCRKFAGCQVLVSLRFSRNYDFGAKK